MSLLTTLQKAAYAATDAQVQELATLAASGQRADGTYLKVLLVACKTGLSKPRARQLSVIDRAHTHFYPLVQAGVGDATIDQRERNRRSTFARTAASTLRTFVGAGGDLRKLEVEEVSKAKLHAYGQPVPTGTRVQRSLQRGVDTVTRAVMRGAKVDPTDTRARLVAAIGSLQDLLDAIETPSPARAARPRPAGGRRGEVSASTH